MEDKDINSENIKQFSFESLDVYKEAQLLSKEVYVLQRQFPVEERYALGDQVRRAISSVTSNIAEGSGRSSFKEKVHFLEISYGSLMEAFSQLQLAEQLGYISIFDLDKERVRFIKVAKMLSGLKASFEKKLLP